KTTSVIRGKINGADETRSSFRFYPMGSCIQQTIGHLLIVDRFKKTKLPFTCLIEFIMVGIPYCQNTPYKSSVFIGKKGLRRRMLIKRMFIWREHVPLS